MLEILLQFIGNRRDNANSINLGWNFFSHLQNLGIYGDVQTSCLATHVPCFRQFIPTLISLHLSRNTFQAHLRIESVFARTDQLKSIIIVQHQSLESSTHRPTVTPILFVSGCLSVGADNHSGMLLLLLLLLMRTSVSMMQCALLILVQSGLYSETSSYRWTV